MILTTDSTATMTWWQISLIVLVVILIVLAILYIAAKRLQKKADSQQDMINQSKQVVSMLIIDKKKLRIKDSKLPKIVQDQVPAYMRWRKMPLVKAKVGPKIETLMCDEKVFKELPVKRNVKVELAGMYIVGLKSYKNKVKGKKQK